MEKYLYNKPNISVNKLTNNVLKIPLQIMTMALQTRDLSKGTSVQVLNELSIEYDFSEPSCIVKSLGKNQELPPFQSTCEIFKNNTTYACIGELASQKEASKQNAAAGTLEMLSTRYVFLEEIEEKCLIPESKIF